MVEVQVNKAAAGDPKAFAMVVQFMDKFEVFKRQTLDHSALADSALEHLHRRLVKPVPVPVIVSRIPTYSPANCSPVALSRAVTRPVP
jgi:hypothetical protein